MMGRGRRVNITKKSKQHTGGFILKKAPKHDKKEAQHHDIDVMLGFDLVPFLSQEELTDIPVLDPISAHVELIKGNNVLGEVVADAVIRAELTVDRFFRCQKISDLNIQFFAALIAYKINFLIACSADSHFITPAQQFQIGDVFQNKIDVPHIAAKDRLADAVIGNIVLLIGGKDLFALQVLPLHLIEKVRLAAVFDIVQNCFRGDGALLVFQELRKRGRREGRSHIGDHIISSVPRKGRMRLIYSSRLIISLCPLSVVDHSIANLQVKLNGKFLIYKL